jgi:hypothetical protein
VRGGARSMPSVGLSPASPPTPSLPARGRGGSHQPGGAS